MRTVEATRSCLKDGGCMFRKVLWTREGRKDGSFEGRSSEGNWRLLSPEEDFLRA